MASLQTASTQEDGSAWTHGGGDAPPSGFYVQLADTEAAPTPVTKKPSASQLLRHSSMTKDELHQLRDWLVTTSASERLSVLSTRSVGQHLDSATHDFTSNNQSSSLLLDEPAVTAATLPRESVAVLIDAVRSSTLRDDEKCRFLFDIFDVDHAGILSRQGVAAFIDATLVANNLQTYGSVCVDGIVAKLFAGTADPNQMTHQEFAHAFRDVVHPTICMDTGASLTKQQHVSQVDQTNTSNAKPAARTFFTRLRRKYRKRSTEVHYLALYAVIMVAAFFIKAHYIPVDPVAGYAPKIAKGFSQIVMCNTLFLLLPMCRKFTAFLRKFAAISSRVPVDQNIEFHKICGVVLLLAAVGHIIAWVVTLHLLRTASDEAWERSHFKHLTFVRDESIPNLLKRTPMWTGITMVVIAAIAAPLARPKVRHGDFNTFWLTHLMFLPFLLLITVHGLAKWVMAPQAGYWVWPPIILYAVERRLRTMSAKNSNTRILRVHFSKDTVAIFMEKPGGFHFHPGMYLYLKVPILSSFEWHPFTISSAPEDDFVSVHIRNAGDWTGLLHAVLRQCLDRPSDNGCHDIEANTAAFPAVCIDGPVGAPSQDYHRYESVVFVGAGIGVTPFASILQSIVHQWGASRCERCSHVKLPKTFRLKKIYFYWITREQEALTWFADTMNQLSAMDTEGRLEIHNYYSPLKSDKVIAPLHALQKLVHDSEGHDIISGLTTKQMTHFGRPDWKRELSKIADQQPCDVSLTVGGTPKKRPVGVFFCGPKPMGNAIHDECAAFNQDEKRSCPGVMYKFHSENF